MRDPAPLTMATSPVKSKALDGGASMVAEIVFRVEKCLENSRLFQVMFEHAELRLRASGHPPSGTWLLDLLERQQKAVPREYT